MPQDPKLLASAVPRVGVGVFIVHPHLASRLSNPKSRLGRQRGWKFLLGERLGSHGSGTWALPGGHLEFGETFEECAAREVLEETGLEINKIEFLTAINDVMPAEGKGGEKHYVTVFMTARVKGYELVDSLPKAVAEDVLEEMPEPKVMEPDKCAGWEWTEWGSLAYWAGLQNGYEKGRELIEKMSESRKRKLPPDQGPQGRRLFSPMVDLFEQRPDVLPWRE
ncbi:hypothetical protein LTR10_015815 [Elasticomyces elasticus]|uniref:Nudix hydrolase domain-containing protein n=1 Tax=Exophiala sideris TaxID=1016849 RepID=A0ABR0IYK5_9EURO|nr:hypothetical protein LTR10_015815 [Elasticomyces elasticus]KAK5022513.1 hypothetical protein LTS07_009959 [Exophiala sideris]KAK5028041.1 hypothetical protein LTR13_009270 [Exophiala sideris]KAK5051782.1 hypothetical protein LTR69_010073 [Exophiala sideris]KAK5177886.1 hypothetical protein LTR44_009651 [Eurotiomycetes sp. CCFEE 6388]